MATLPDLSSRYDAKTPYATLGLESPDADAREIRDTYNELNRDLQESNTPPQDRARRTQELETAYEQLRTAGTRVQVDFFLLDRNLGRKQCAAIAEKIPKPKTEVEGVIKPRNIKVSHEILFDALKEFFTDPPRVKGVFPAVMELGGTELPDLLDIRFDC